MNNMLEKLIKITKVLNNYYKNDFEKIFNIYFFKNKVDNT